MNSEPQITSHERQTTSGECVGSALILTVVLTSLLAIVGVLFVMVARVDKIETSAISENKELDFAVETIVAKISQDLAFDIPCTDPNGQKRSEFYDYPGAKDKWLANLEPYKLDSNYYWRQISDVYNKFDSNLQLQAEIVPDYQDASVIVDGAIADADGDGVADSRWVIIPDVSSCKSKPIFAAIRIVDNGSMLNVNTAYKFDPNDPNATVFDIDGSSQMQINLESLARGDDDLSSINVARGLSAIPTDLELKGYETNVIWRIENPHVSYLPFDISDELILRNRYIIDQDDTITRLKNVWPGTFDRKGAYCKNFPYTLGDSLSAWFDKTGNGDFSYYIPRHISTTYNMDRIIKPDCSKMININTIYYQGDLEKLANAIWLGLRDAGVNDDALAAQIAVNIKDYRDEDSNVSAYNGYYGFESPCIYISEVAYSSVTVGEPPTTYISYAVELYKPYAEDAVSDTGVWRLAIVDVVNESEKLIDIDLWPEGKKFYVVLNEDANAPITVDQDAIIQNSPKLAFGADHRLDLKRYVVEQNGTGKYIKVDSIYVPEWLVSGDGTRSYQRDITLHKSIRRLWDPNTAELTLGSLNSYVDSARTEQIQAHPSNQPFKNIGEIGMVLFKCAYSQGPNPIGPSDTEATSRINLTDLVFQQILNYLTVFDPAAYPWNDPNETRVKGRININTAPWFVIAQLPWMTPPIARAIVAYRDKLQLSPNIVDYSVGRARGMWDLEDPSPGIWVREEPGFNNVAELLNVTHALTDERIFPVSPAPYEYWYDIRKYARDKDPNGADIDQLIFPDLTPGDRAANDFEERDLIFSRISNLITVRSDVFTAYILVRIGVDGPQKRVVAILDRSQAYSSDGKVRIVALHPVPDPR